MGKMTQEEKAALLGKRRERLERLLALDAPDCIVYSAMVLVKKSQRQVYGLSHGYFLPFGLRGLRTLIATQLDALFPSRLEGQEKGWIAQWEK